ncbi:DnaJ domain-containing protein [Candidatus Daviesbacteria bacterium]|nr:DnaJ domain-containing protein [Candidatus Daviesbacteria bacterium]
MNKIIHILKKRGYQEFLIFLLLFVAGIGFGNLLTKKNTVIPAAEKDISKAFVSEIYDKIKENYWNNISDVELLDLFKLSIDRNGGQTDLPKFDNKEKLLDSVSSITKKMDEEKRNKFITQVAQTVLASLNPPQRSGLFTEKQEEQLKNTVSNINPDKDLYKDLEVNKEASKAAIEQAYQKKSQQLSQDQSPKAKEKLKEIAYAKDVLTGQDSKVRYDTNKVEPTIFYKTIEPAILYVQFKKFSPTSYEEFIKAFETYQNDSNLSSLIFDLRGNIGGAIDATAYFLGNFIGQNQYAFDFYHKGEYLPFKTPTNKLASISKYKQVVILIDNQTQSSAEMMAVSLKKFHVGVVLGTNTKGWGTVEKVFPLDNQIDPKQKYSMFLVHSITLRDDNQPIEGRGVEPDINITKADWQQLLFLYFRNDRLTEAVKSLL